MQRSIMRLVVTLTVLAVVSGGAGAAPPVALAGAPLEQAACAEPNNEFQAACVLPTGWDVTGTIEKADDVDAYRFVVLDFDAVARVDLFDLPAPYDAHIADWRGDVIASSSPSGGQSEMVQVTLTMPGVYYVFVRSKAGAFNASQPYHLTATVDYGPRATRRDAWQQSMDTERAQFFSEDKNVEYLLDRGKITMTLKEGGTADTPYLGRLRIQATTHQPVFGPEFALTFDVRQPAGANAGFWVSFGTNYDGSAVFHRVTVDVQRNAVMLTRHDGETVEQIVPMQTIGAADQQGGVNRIAVHTTETETRVNLNGQDILRVSGQQATPGPVAFGTISWGQPIATVFDNFALTVRG